MKLLTFSRNNISRLFLSPYAYRSMVDSVVTLYDELFGTRISFSIESSEENAEALFSTLRTQGMEYEDLIDTMQKILPAKCDTDIKRLIVEMMSKGMIE